MARARSLPSSASGSEGSRERSRCSSPRRRQMWVKIDDAAPLHPKLLDAGAEAAWLWVAGLAHANRHTTDGRIEGRHLAALYAPLGSKTRRLARKLVEIGLWIECGDGYLIHDYEDYQEQAMSDAREEKRARDAERARRYRER